MVTWQRFARLEDLDLANCTIEEREEYEPHILAGNIVYAGVDYARILEAAERECRVLLWDGGNNDFSFIKPDLNIVLVDPLRPDSATTHHPGEAVLRMADVVVVAKTNSAAEADVRKVIDVARQLAPRAIMVKAASIISLDAEKVKGRRVLVVDDGPTITHGGMPYGAGYVAAAQAGAAEIVDPRPAAVGDLAEVFRKFSHITRVLPALGYSEKELSDLQETINRSEADVVVAGTPSDLTHLMKLSKPVVRAHYEFAEVGEPRLSDLIRGFLRSRDLIRDVRVA
jgi:predicted GTPase